MLLVSKEPLPAIVPLGQAVIAGAVGTTGLLLLFHAMASGKMSIATPVSALMAATLPVVVGTFVDGFPSMVTFLGLTLSLAAIWLISHEEGNHSRVLDHISDLRLPLLAGLFFGTYFIIIHRVAQDATIWPMFSTRIGGVLIMVTYMLVQRKSWKIVKTAWSLILINSVFDVGGNGFFILASQLERLDVSAVLSSLYPAATVILAAILLKERVARSQAIGIFLALLAIAFLTG
jgi:uncharacterized membrane protein